VDRTKKEIERMNIGRSVLTEGVLKGIKGGTSKSTLFNWREGAGVLGKKREKSAGGACLRGSRYAEDHHGKIRRRDGERPGSAWKKKPKEPVFGRDDRPEERLKRILRDEGLSRGEEKSSQWLA